MSSLYTIILVRECKYHMLNRHPFINTLSNWAKMQSREPPTSHVVTIKERADSQLDHKITISPLLSRDNGTGTGLLDKY